VFSGEARNTNFIVFGLTQSGLETTIYRTRGEHNDHYATVVVMHCCWTMFVDIADTTVPNLIDVYKIEMLTS
jgi:hypothetical protein